jgi:hypothetical protein
MKVKEKVFRVSEQSLKTDAGIFLCIAGMLIYFEAL